MSPIYSESAIYSQHRKRSPKWSRQYGSEYFYSIVFLHNAIGFGLFVKAHHCVVGGAQSEVRNCMRTYQSSSAEGSA